MKSHNILTIFFLIVTFLTNVCYVPLSFAQEEQNVNATEQTDTIDQREEVEEEEEPTMVEINGDTVEYDQNTSTVHARGNVVIDRGDLKLEADEVSFTRSTGKATARGNVVLTRGNTRIFGDKMNFNFEDMSGDFMGAQIYAYPYYGRGETISKVGDNHMVMSNGYITTSDYDKPEYRIKSKKIDIYPGDKAVARHVRLLVGKVPIFYLPKFTQDLRDKKPRFIFTPGYDKDWGGFLLTQWRFYLNEDVKGTLHLDYRERLDLAEGLDVEYNTKKYGSGNVKTYYTNERKITSERFYEERPSPTIERERFKAEWRHKWKIDSKTNAIFQYYKLSDADFLKDFFEREHEKDPNPTTYVLLTRAAPKGTFSFETKARVNRFVGAVERLPELKYDLPNVQVGDTDFYFSNKTTFSNLTKKSASPSDVRDNTMRFDIDNLLSYPFKFSIFELKPFIGGRQTYYSKTEAGVDDDVIRGAFRTGATMQTKFYRIFETKINKGGMRYNRLRHVITPSVSYSFQKAPTMPDSQLVQYDSLDTLTQSHSVTLSLENKLQTKRNNKSVDVLRIIGDTNFKLKESAGKGGFNSVNADIEFLPTDWATLSVDSKYDSIDKRIKFINFDLYLDSKIGWFDVAKRFDTSANDQITTEFGIKMHPKWLFKVYHRFDLDGGFLEEHNYSLVRDLHSWTVELSLNDRRSRGSEIFVVFTLKAFPDIGFDFGTRFNRRRTGSQAEDD